MTTTRTMVVVHAHPDDEAIFTAGATMLYAERGVRVVLVTCTNGRLGIDHAGRGGDHPDHDQRWTIETRAQELAVSAQRCGVQRFIDLGYDDSGMRGWPQNEEANAFVTQPTSVVAERIRTILDEEGADVVVTYDERGFYGHPDHVKAHEVTMAAVASSATVQRVYFPEIPESVRAQVRTVATEQELDVPAWVTHAKGTPDDLITTVLPTLPYAAAKHEAIASHASQTDNAEILAMAPVVFAGLFGTEYYRRGWSRGPVRGDEQDFFGGM